MAQSKKVYTSPQAGQPLISTISTQCKTPLLEVKFCNLFKPYYYSNSPTVPRYSITCIVDVDLHKDFLKGIQTIEKNEDVDSIIKNEVVKQDGESVTTGKVLVKFQSKDIIPIFEYGQFPPEETPKIDLDDELAHGEQVMVVYDILRYTKKNTMKTEHGLSFKPSAIFLKVKEN